MGIERKDKMKQRQTELDILRFLAMIAVVVIHAGRIPAVASLQETIPFEVSIAPLVWCVPVFFMISGRFFLDEERNVTLKKLFHKYIFRLITAFAVWSAVYTAYYVLDGTYHNLNIYGILAQYIHGPVHFWYLYAMIGLYLLTPLLRRIAMDRKVLAYILVLFCIYNVITQYLIHLPQISGIIESTVSRLGLDLLNGYLGCFLLGHFLYITREKITEKFESAIYLLGIILFVLTYVLDISISEELRNSDFVKQYQKPNVIIFSAAIYLFFIKRVSNVNFSENVRGFFAKTAEYGFGVYILHALVIEFAKSVQIPECTPFFAAIVFVSAAIILASLLLTALIRKIPYVGKIIV